MLALQISLNGQRVATAGTSGAVNACVTIDALGAELRRLKPGQGPVIMRLGGLSHSPGQKPEVLEWLGHQACSVGDVITIEVVEMEEAETDRPRRTPLPPAAGSYSGSNQSLLRRWLVYPGFLHGWFKRRLLR